MFDYIFYKNKLFVYIFSIKLFINEHDISGEFLYLNEKKIYFQNFTQFPFSV